MSKNHLFHTTQRNRLGGTWLRFSLAVTLAATTGLLGCGGDDGSVTTDRTDASDPDASDPGDAGEAADSVDADTLPGPDGGNSDAGAGVGDGGATDAGPTAKYTTCSAVGDCVATACKIGKPGCEQACFAESSAAALQLAVPLLSCYQDKCLAATCKDSEDPNCATACITQQCIGDFMPCIETTTTGTQLCGSAFDCFDACDVTQGDGFACHTACLADLTAQDAKLIFALGTCLKQNPGQAPDKACSKELFSCAVGATSGDDACVAAFKCSSTCQKAGGKEDACLFKCAGKLTKKAQTAFADLLPCFELADMNTDPACRAALKVCIDPSGSDDCADTYDCAAKCPENKKNPSCLFECLHASTTAAYDAFYGLVACSEAATPTDAPTGATATNDSGDFACAKQFLTCAAPSGPDDCKPVFKCMQGCQSGKSAAGENPMTCMFDCAASGSSQAFTDFLTFAGCFGKCEVQCKAGGTGENCAVSCLQQACPAVLAACVAL